jgi:methyl-accepting chemotaxis protein
MSVNDSIAKVKLYDSGYGFLVSRGGVFVAAPQKGLIGKRTLRDLAKAKSNPALARIADAVAAGKPGRVETTDPFTGKEVVMSWAPVEHGSWGFVSVAPTAEVFAAANRLRTLLLGLGLVVLIAVAGIVAFIARRLTAPITRVTEAAEKVSEGDVEVEVEDSGDDEIGRTAAAFRRTVDYLREKAEAAERGVAGDLTVDVEPRSERDLLGTAFRT